MCGCSELFSRPIAARKESKLCSSHFPKTGFVASTYRSAAGDTWQTTLQLPDTVLTCTPWHKCAPDASVANISYQAAIRTILEL